MTERRHRQIAKLFHAACELDPMEQADYIARACDDEGLRAEVLALLEYDERRAHPGLAGPDTQRGARIRRALRDTGDAEEASAPPRIGLYTLHEKLGEGGMGEVYAAQQEHPIARRVALKLIKKGMDSAQVITRFEAERQVLAIMAHPNIAQIFDGGATEDGRPYFVMELVAGKPITDHCDARGLSTRERLELFLEVCDGVQHAHRKGVIHRDLKPSNVLVTELDGRATPKIIDFGVARATTETKAGRALHTRIGQVIGTLDYMSPEQADPTQLDIDTRADIYSLGVLLYQLVTGLLPFDHSCRANIPLSEVRRVICEVDPPTPSIRVRALSKTDARATRPETDGRALIRQLSGDLDWITLKALEKDPDRRYPSAAAFADDIRRHLSDEPVLASPPGTIYRARKWIRRHRVGATAGVLIVAALTTGLFGIVSGSRQAEARATELLRLSDGRRLLQLQLDAKSLWPPHPDRIDGLIALRARAETLVAGLSDHVSTMNGRDWDFRSTEDTWQHGLLSELIVEIERIQSELLGAPHTSKTYGWNIAKRIEVAADLAPRFDEGGDLALAWEDALPQIRAAYPGLEISPQMGLKPIGQDPDSGLWEFAHLITGVPAERSPETGHVVMADESGVVLVLLPGGRFWMGGQGQDEEAQNYVAALADFPFEEMTEMPVHEVAVEPFFISKFELTRAQWIRFAEGGDDAPPPRKEWTRTLPMGGVTMAECETFTYRVGLAVPTEEEWEYAARAGSSAPWSCGSEEASLRDSANLYDESVAAKKPGLVRMMIGRPVPWNDHYAMFSVVGTFLPNLFGLYDVHGNVGEFCRVHRGLYSAPRQIEPLDITISRGGSSHSDAYVARCSFRGFSQGMDFKHIAAGIRPSRAIINR